MQLAPLHSIRHQIILYRKVRIVADEQMPSDGFPGLLAGMRVLVVGGGGAGIGAAIARSVAASGAHVAVVDRDRDRALLAAKELAAYGNRAIGLVGDVLVGPDIDRFVTEARDELGGLDGLVSVVGGLNAFNIPFHRVHECSDEEWDLVFDLNLRYVFRLTRAVLQSMLEQGCGGSIVSVGSHAGGWHGSPNMAAYGAAKIGVSHLAMSVTTEYGRDGIRMNVVSPGSTETPASGVRSAEQLERVTRAIPMGRRGRPTDIANAVLFFLSPLSKYVSGETIGADGGLSVASQLPNADWGPLPKASEGSRSDGADAAS